MAKKLFRQIGLGLILLSLCSTAFAQDGTLLVANRVGGSISMIDLASKVEIARLPIGPYVPHEVDVSPDGRWALTTEYGPNSDPGRHLVLIDIVNARIVGRIDLGENSRPHTALFLPDSRHAVATMQDSDQLALVDTFTLEILRTYPTGGREGHMVRLSPDGSIAYVASRGGDGHLSVVYLDEDRAPTVILTGAGAEGLAVSPDGSEVWVSNRLESTISIIDTGSMSVVDQIDARQYAGRIEISESGHVAVPNGGGGQIVPQYARIYDLQSREVLREVAIRDGEPGAGNFGIFIHGETLFVSDPTTKNIQVFDMTSMNEPEELAFGMAGPDGMAWSPFRVRPLEQYRPEQ